MRKLFASSVLATSVLLPFNVLADDSASQYIVSKDSEVRKGATYQYDVVTKLHSGQTAKVIDEFVNSSGEKWYRVDLDTLKGWVPATSFSVDSKRLIGENAKVSANSVNVRKGPGTEYTSITKFHTGQLVSVSEVSKNARGEIWYKLSSGTIEGWIISDYLEKTTAVAGASTIDGKSYEGTQQKVGFSNVNLRSGATTSYKVKAVIPANTVLEILDSFTNAKNEVWFNVEFNGQKGWVISNQFSLSSTGVVNGTSLNDGKSYIGSTQKIGSSNTNLRAGATTSYDVKAVVPANTALKIIDSFTNAKDEVWFNVSYNGKKGWILSDQFSLSSTGIVDNSNTIDGSSYVGTTQKVGIVNTNMRSGATTSYKVAAIVPANTALKVLDSFTNAKGEVWFNVSYDGKKGWILSDQFSLSSTGIVDNSNTIDGSSYVGTTQRVGKVNTNMRSGATTSYKVATVVPANTALKILASFTNAKGEVWFNVSYDGKKGWIISEQFSLSSTGIVDNSNTTTGKSYIGTTQKLGSASVNMRSGATTSYGVVKLVPANTSLKILDAFTNAKKEVWFNVSYDGKKGWILSDLFQLSSTSDSEQQKIVVNQSTVHSGATSSYKVVYTAKSGTTLPIHSEFVNAKGEKWYNVTYAAGKKGWIKANAFENVSSAPAPIEKEVNLRISVPVANMRSGPGTSYDVVTQSKLNDYFVSVDVAEDANKETWYKVNTAQGDAWLHQSVVQANVDIPQATDTIQTFKTTLYKDASFGSSAVAVLAQGTKITVSGSINDISGIKWLNVSTSTGHSGWIPEFETVTQLPVKYAKSKVNVYSGASTTYRIVETVPVNGAVKVLYSLNGWYNVETPKQTRGWIQASSVADVSPVSLINGRDEVRNGQNYLVWTKPSNFKISYSMPSANVLRVFGNLSDVSDFTSSIPGVESIKKERVSGGTAVMLITFDPAYTYTIRDYNNEMTVKVMKKGLAGKKILIDPGHGGDDPGAVGPNGVQEKNVNLSTAMHLKNELEAAGASVYMTRSRDEFITLSGRANASNKSDYDAFISIHANAFTSTSRGTETLYYSSTFNAPKSKLMADQVHKEMVASLGTYDRKVKSQNIHVLRENNLPSILVELAFLSNPTEEALLNRDSFRKSAAIGIRKGLESYFSK